MSSGTTTNYFLSYPLSTDPVNVAGDIQELAEDLDDFLTSPIFINNIGISGGVINTTSPSATIFPANATSMSIGNIATNISLGSNSGSTTINNASAIFGGIIQIQGNSLKTNQSVFNLLDTATTINLGASATVINVGSSVGQVNVGGNLSIGNNKVYEINDVEVLSSSALGSGVVSSSLSAVGTITTGIWEATTIAVDQGGTGLTSYAIGDIIYASASSTLEKLSDVETGNALISGGVNAAPFWGKINLSTHIAGTLAVENGGTGVSYSTGSSSVVLSDSPTLTGTPISTTASVGTTTTQIATTEFVINQASSATPLSLGSASAGSSTRYAREDHIHPNIGLGLISGTLAQFSSTTSSELASIISDETGSGSLVFGTSPTITTPLFSGNSRISGSAPTISSASVISPNTEILFVSGSATVSTINTPFGAGNGGRITIIPTGLFSTNISGNIALATTAVVGKALIMTYDPTTQKWYPSY